MNAIQFPLTRVSIGLILGILLARYYPLPPLSSLLLLGSLLLFFIFLYLLVKKRPKLIPLLGLSVFCLSMGCGFTSFTLDRENTYANHFLQVLHHQSTQQIEVVLREKLKTTDRYYRFVAQVKRINQKDCFGKMLIYGHKAYFHDKNIGVGSRLCIASVVYTPQPQMNPGNFDYWDYLQLKNIYGQVFAQPQNTVVQGPPQQDLFYWIEQIRSRALLDLQKKSLSPTSAQVLAALIVGQQQEINAEIIRDFQSAGAVHILSVSGLHVGFIVLFLNFALQLLPKNRKTRWLKLGLILISLWGFALLAGLSASVVRSVTMYSLVAVALSLKRTTETVHTLLVSLMLILLVAPSLLFDVGLQLSYAALFFIVWLQPILASAWSPKYKISSYFWSIITVSLAAQIGTLPLSLYYFHQFPGLFLLTNVLIIPLIGLIMAVGVPMMMLAALGWTPQPGTTLIELLIRGLNFIVHKIGALDDFVFQNIPFAFSMLCAAYFLNVCLIRVLKQMAFSRIVWLLISILTCQISYASALWTAQQKREWLVLHQRKNTLIIDRYGLEAWVYHTGQANSFAVENYQVQEHIQKIHYKPVACMAQFKAKKILLVNQANQYPQNASATILVLYGRPRINLERLLQHCNPQQVIADGSNYRFQVEQWKQTCQKQKIPFYYTGKKGFFKLTD